MRYAFDAKTAVQMQMQLQIIRLCAHTRTHTHIAQPIYSRVYSLNCCKRTEIAFIFAGVRWHGRTDANTAYKHIFISTHTQCHVNSARARAPGRSAGLRLETRSAVVNTRFISGRIDSSKVSWFTCCARTQNKRSW